MRKHLSVVSLGVLAALIAAGLLFGPGGLRPDPPNAEAALHSQIKKLVASDAMAGNGFGASVAVSGDTAVVGAGLFNSAYVFQRDEGGQDNWGEVKILTSSDAQGFDLFGNNAAINGDTIIVGAHLEDDGGLAAGAAYIFHRDEGGTDNWGEVKKLTASDAQAASFFGGSVAVSGGTAIVGAYEEDNEGGPRPGAAYVFQRDEGGADNWGEVKKLTASDAQAADRFGNSVAISGDTAIVGAFLEDAGGTDAGAAYVFQRDEGGTDNWGEVAKLTASDAQAGDEFGADVAVSDDDAVAGALGDGCESAAYVFHRNEGGTDNWGEVTKLTASDASCGAIFGSGVAVSGDLAAVGAYRVNAAYAFRRNQGGADNWGQVARLSASPSSQGLDYFGWSAAVVNDTIFVGANQEGEGGLFAGAVYVFDVPIATPTPTFTNTPTITQTPTITPTPTVTPTKQPDPGDTDGDGCSDARENGPDETLGGQRDYLNPWDFYDAAGPGGGPPDGVIDLPNDILGVISHFAPTGAPPYDVAFDRGHRDGKTLWSMTAPDGVIDLPIDILGVIYQFGHSCQ